MATLLSRLAILGVAFVAAYNECYAIAAIAMVLWAALYLLELYAAHYGQHR